MGNSFKIETLSPVHIGSGNTFKPMDIGEYERYIYIFDFDKVIEKIPEHSIDKFSELIINFGDKNKNKYKDMGQMLLEAFGIGYEQWEEISSYKVKRKDIGQIHEIYEALKYGNKVYIPGSSIKGAIRTAIVYSFLKREGYKFYLKETERIKYLCMIKPNDEEVEGVYKGNVDLSKIEEEIKKDMLMDDATRDVFKCLNISDSFPIPAENCLEVRKIYVANTTSFVKQRGSKKISIHPLFVECIRPGEVFNGLKIKVNDKAIEALSEIYRNRKHTFDKITELIKNWRSCLMEFTKDLINAEKSFWQNNSHDIKVNITSAYGNSPHKYITKEFKIEDLIKSLEDIEQSGQVLIRIGKYSGYLTHSIGLLIAKGLSGTSYNLAGFGKILSIYNHDELFPLTRRLTLDNQTLGWCKLVESNDSENEDSEYLGNSDSENKQNLNSGNLKEAFKSKGWRIK